MNTVERSILQYQLDADLFHSEAPKCAGIARRAVEHGYTSLSVAQQQVLRPFLSQCCSGYSDPAGHHPCDAVLEGQQLLQAYKEADFGSESVECSSCRFEAVDVAYRKEKALRDD